MSMLQKSVINSIKQDESLVALSCAKFQEFYIKTEKEYTKLKKIKLADKLEERNSKNDWKALFENDKKEVLKLQSQINITDKEIDSMVYELYRLSEDEIKIVEIADVE